MLVPRTPRLALRSRDVRRSCRGRPTSELERLQVELVHLQSWVVGTGAKVCIVFEGRDTAGKGGVIKRITERVSPGSSASSRSRADRAREEPDVRAAVPGALPGGGEVAIFDRSWYNRAGVERVMGFATEAQVERFLRLVPAVEQAMVDPGSSCSSTGSRSARRSRPGGSRRRIDDGRKTWKLSPMDLESYSRWYDYSRARDEMFAHTDTAVGAVVRRRLERQEAGPAQHHQPPARPDPLRADAARPGEAAGTSEARSYTEPPPSATRSPPGTDPDLFRAAGRNSSHRRSRRSRSTPTPAQPPPLISTGRVLGPPPPRRIAVGAVACRAPSGPSSGRQGRLGCEVLQVEQFGIGLVRERRRVRVEARHLGRAAVRALHREVVGRGIGRRRPRRLTCPPPMGSTLDVCHV